MTLDDKIEELVWGVSMYPDNFLLVYLFHFGFEPKL
jgi:hypothetical protein